MAKAVIFLSHAAAEAPVASVLKDAIQNAFLGMADVFVSSDRRSLKAGQRWLPTITTNLRDAVLMLVLASPRSLARSWVNFEAGAAWMRDIDVIPLCHSGVTPSTLPMPLREFQSLQLLGSPDDLRSLVEAIARHVGCDIPSVDVHGLAKDLEDAIAKVVAASTAVVPSSRLRDRGLSEDRERLEADVHQRILRTQRLRAAGATAQDYRRFSEFVSDAERFMEEPDSFGDDRLRDVRDRFDEVIEDLSGDPPPRRTADPRGGGSERVTPQPADIEQALLKALRDLEHKQARSSAILPLDLDEVARAVGGTRDAVQDSLVDLLALGQAEGFGETMTDRKEDGHCRITPYGMASIRD